MKNEDYETVVTIEPSFVDDYNTDDLLMSVAHVRVEYLVKGRLLFSATFDKILSETRFTDDSMAVDKSEDILAVREANDMICCDLSAIGLGGLETLDIFSHIGDEIPTSKEIKSILISSLCLPYIEQDGHSPFVYQTKDGFYDLDVLRYNVT